MRPLALPMTAHRYHHGDLAASLEREATAMIRAGGIESLSMRKLAAQVGVTPAALYHHYRDKNALLCALAERGFEALEREVSIPDLAGLHEGARAPSERAIYARMRELVHAYVGFADANPELYDLMFGRTIWKAGEPTEALRAIAHGSFRRYLDQISALIAELGMATRTNEGTSTRKSPLRSAQASWALLHGLCRLRIDGIYVDTSDLDAMSDEAARLILAHVRAGSR